MSARTFIGTFNFDLGRGRAMGFRKRRDPDATPFDTKTGLTLAVGTRMGYSFVIIRLCGEFLARRWRQHVPIVLLCPRLRFGRLSYMCFGCIYILVTGSLDWRRNGGSRRV